MKRVCLVVLDDVVKDARVLKLKDALAKEYDLKIVGITEAAGENPPGIILARSFWFSQLVKVKNYMKTRTDTAAKGGTANQGFSFMGLIRDLFRHFYFTAGSRAIYKELKKIDSDVYHANDLDVLGPCARVAKAKGAKLVYDSHELYLEMGLFRTDYMQKRYLAMEGRLIKKADKVITVNRFIAEELARRYGVPTPEVIHNYPEPCNSVPPKRGDTTIRVLYQGAYGPGRGLDELVKSAKILPEGYQIYLRGVGAYGKILEQLAQNTGSLDKNVFFLQPLPPNELIEKATFADVGITFNIPYCLNNYFASPNKVFEYLSAGLAVISNKIPFLEEVIGGRSGVLIDEVTTQSVAGAIVQFTSSNIMNYRVAAYESSKKYVWEKEKLLGVYRSLFG
ncbi:MAG: glycosyltransferase family 4 protein [Candidatus Methanomethylicaceae archaeon]